MSRLHIVTLLIYLLCRVHHEKRWAGRSTAGIKIAGRNNNKLRYADDTSLMAGSEEELKSLLMKVKVESEKAIVAAIYPEESDYYYFMADVCSENPKTYFSKNYQEHVRKTNKYLTCF